MAPYNPPHGWEKGFVFARGLRSSLKAYTIGLEAVTLISSASKPAGEYLHSKPGKPQSCFTPVLGI
jgi:hypothetical protein